MDFQTEWEVQQAFDDGLGFRMVSIAYEPGVYYRSDFAENLPVMVLIKNQTQTVLITTPAAEKPNKTYE